MKNCIMFIILAWLVSTMELTADTGLIFGGNVHKWVGNDASEMSSAFSEVFESNYSAKSRMGFSIGAFYQVYNTKNLSIQPEIHWIMKGNRYKGSITYSRYTFDTQIAFNMNYIELPLLVRLNIAPEPNEAIFNLFGGPFIAFNAGTTLVVTVDDEREEKKMKDFESSGYGYTVGGGVHYPAGFFIDIRYHRDLSSNLADATLYNQVIGLYFGIAY